MTDKDAKKIFDKMLREVPKNMDLSKYSFNCSREHETDITEYKGYPVYYYNIIPEDTIYFMINQGIELTDNEMKLI
tara:strand:- start:4703 stop:4930 length:228 start_codon:yes stop_codon:yes gene_type:complete